MNNPIRIANRLTARDQAPPSSPKCPAFITGRLIMHVAYEFARKSECNLDAGLNGLKIAINKQGKKKWIFCS